jgi:hypothetical protein
MPNTYSLIASSTVGAGGAASIDFTSIPSTYTDLCLKLSLRSTYAARSNSVFISLNGSTSSFSSKIIEGSGSSAYSFSSARNIGAINAANSTANTFNNLEIYIPNYAGSNNKSFSSDSVQEDNQTEAYADLTANLWSSSSAITAIGLANSAGNFAQYSTAYLYGVKNA